MISRNLRHIPKTTLWAVLVVLSQSVLFCDAPHLAASNKKFGRAALDVNISLVLSETITNYSLLITNYFNPF